MLFVLGDITERSEMRNIWWKALHRAYRQLRGMIWNTRRWNSNSSLSQFSRNSLVFLFSSLSFFSWDQLQVLAAEKWRNSANWNFWFFFLNFPEAVILHNKVVMCFLHSAVKFFCCFTWCLECCLNAIILACVSLIKTFSEIMLTDYL